MSQPNQGRPQTDDLQQNQRIESRYVKIYVYCNGENTETPETTKNKEKK